jgi:hypothetical protein
LYSKQHTLPILFYHLVGVRLFPVTFLWILIMVTGQMNIECGHCSRVGWGRVIAGAMSAVQPLVNCFVCCTTVKCSMEKSWYECVKLHIIWCWSPSIGFLTQCC